MKEKKSLLTSNRKSKYKQYLSLAAFIGLLGLAAFGLDYIIAIGNTPKGLKQKKEQEEKIRVDLATYAIKGEKLWQNNFDERLSAEKQARSDQYVQMLKTIEGLEEKLQSEKDKNAQSQQSEILTLKEQIAWIRKELTSIGNVPKQDSKIQANIGSITNTKISEPEKIEAAKDMNHYIPAGSFISGVLRGGVSASTGTGAPSEPTPIFIMITGYGDLPKTFKANLTNCRLVGSSFGNLANERVIGRVETMSCTNYDAGLVTETDIVGVVHSTDSKNGIKGTVISMSDKHLKNAFIGGVLSGFAQTGKQGDSLLFNPGFGTVSKKQSGFKEKLGENSLVGLGNAAEKIADYHLKMAEATAPVIEVPGGARVTVFFSKGVFLGSKNIKEQLNQERK